MSSLLQFHQLLLSVPPSSYPHPEDYYQVLWGPWPQASESEPDLPCEPLLPPTPPAAHLDEEWAQSPDCEVPPGQEKP
jgi:hypothetical protein